MPTLRSCLAFGLLALAGIPARADLNYASFPNTTGIQLVTNAAVTSSVLRLTSNATNRVGAGWATTQQSVGAGFSTTFTFRITSGSGADGFAFVIQNSSATAIGGGGCQLGYHGIPNSVAVEFDTYTSGTCITGAGSVADPNDNHVSVHTKGTAPNSAEESASIGINASIPTLKSGTTHTCTINYAPGQMDVYLDDATTPRISAPIDLATSLSLNGGKAWVGFTGATGGLAEAHDIASWTLTEGAPPGSGRPRTPVFTEPNFDGRIVNAQDVHMETGPFFSPLGYNHLCTDWEIWTVNPAERVWFTSCIMGIEKVHTHLGDGTFMGSYAGRHDLIPNTNYQMKARHRDDSGIAATEWSLYGLRNFTTAPPGSNVPLALKDVLGTPLWSTSAGTPVSLPAANGGTPAAMYLDAFDGSILLSYFATDAGTSVLTNPGQLSGVVQARVRLFGGSAGLSLPKTQLRFADDLCVTRTIYIPAVTLSANQSSLFWVSTAGSTYIALSTQDHASLTTLARATEQPYLITQNNYVVEKFATGLQLPVNIAFVPNPGPNPTDTLCYVTELYGAIKRVTRSGQISDFATGLLNFNPTGVFPGSGEQGLAGLVVDPTNGDLFATVLYDPNPADADTSTHYPKIIKLHSTDGGLTASSITTVLQMPNETMGQSHQISNISFGPDGYLYVHVGDGFDATKGQDLTSFRGKVLRMDRNGQPIADNPFFNATDGITARDYVWAYGYRNPFGGTWRSSDASHYIVENGPSVDRQSKLVRGRNMLYDGSDASMANFAMYNWDPSHAPVNIAFAQSSVFGGSGFPAAKLDHAFVAESGPTNATGPQPLGKRIVEFVIDASGNLVSGPTSIVEYAGEGQGSCVAITAGPDALYFSDLYKDIDYTTPIDRGAAIWRIRYTTARGCCRADFDGVGGLSIDDIFAYLNSWFAGDPRADFDGMGGVTIDDIFVYLNAWFAGC